jgi:hypothetical protein
MNGVVVIGEGEKDEAPMLFNGEHVGDGTGPDCDVAVDPIDGTTLTAKGMANAISVLAVAPRGSMYDPSAVFYMEKLVTGPEAADVVDIRLPVAENIRRVAKAKNETPADVSVVMLDRPRHDGLAQEIRDTGARIRYIVDGDVALGTGAVADLLAVVEHGGVVLLALADDDDPAHADGRDHRAHGLDRGAVGLVLLTAAHPAAAGHGGCLGDTNQLESEVAIRLAVLHQGPPSAQNESAPA